MSLVIPSNPFRKPQAKKIFAKVGVFAKTGVGKTHFALGSPNPAVVDFEHGTDWFIGRPGFSNWEVMEGLVGDATEQVHAALSFLESGFEKENLWDQVLKRNVERLTDRRAIDPATGQLVHDRETFVIDPITLLWENIQFNQALKVERSSRQNKEDYTHKDWGDMKRDYKGFMNRMVNLPMHACVLLRGADVVVDGKITGAKGDAEKSTEFAFDLFGELINPMDPKNRDRRDFIVHKDRSQTYRQGDRIENVSWQTLVVPILARLGGRRDLDEMAKTMYRTWKSKGVSNDAARAIIFQQTGKEKTEDLTADELRQLTDHFAAMDGGDAGAGGNPAGAGHRDPADAGGASPTGAGE